MTRRAARITEDEVRRAVKAVLALGLPVARVSFNGDKVDVIIGESGETSAPRVDAPANDEGLIREPQS